MNHLQCNGLVILGRETDCYQISHIPAIEEASCVSVSVVVRGKVEGTRDVGAVVSTRISCVFVWSVEIRSLDAEVIGLGGVVRFVPHSQCRVIFAKNYNKHSKMIN